MVLIDLFWTMNITSEQVNDEMESFYYEDYNTIRTTVDHIVQKLDDSNDFIKFFFKKEYNIDVDIISETNNKTKESYLKRFDHYCNPFTIEPLCDIFCHSYVIDSWLKMNYLIISIL